jgi:hypothetical protein
MQALLYIILGLMLFQMIKFRPTWGRCYDRNFLRFVPIFGGKIGGFIKYQCYDHFLQKLAVV